MDFNKVTALLHEGKRIRMKKWNSKYFIYLEKGKTIPNKVLREPQKTWFPNGMKIIEHLNYVSAKGNVLVGFTPYTNEVMKGDWEEYVGD